MCSRVVAATYCEKGASLSTIETVDTANPLARATSANVTWPDFLWATALSSNQRQLNDIGPHWPNAWLRTRGLLMASPVVRSFLQAGSPRVDPGGQTGEARGQRTRPDCQSFPLLAVNNDFNPFFYRCLHAPKWMGA